MLRADEAFELMQQRAREAQERGWHVPRDLDGQSLQQKYPQDLQLGYSEQQAKKRHRQRHRAALHNRGLVHLGTEFTETIIDPCHYSVSCRTHLRKDML